MKNPSLGPKDKTRAAHGYGYDFHHTAPQRRVPTVIGDLLAPASADDIPPVSAAALQSVQRAFDLLAQLVGDRDHNLYMGNADRDGKGSREAEAVARIRNGVLAILRTLPDRASTSRVDVVCETCAAPIGVSCSCAEGAP